MSYLSDIADLVWTASNRALDEANAIASDGTYVDDIGYAVWTASYRSALHPGSFGLADFSLGGAPIQAGAGKVSTLGMDYTIGGTPFVWLQDVILTLSSVLDEEEPSNVDYTQSETNPVDSSFEVKLGPLTDPGVHTNHILTIRLRKALANGSHSAKIQLNQGPRFIGSPRVFGIVGLPSKGVLKKPAPGSQIDWQHPLAQGLVGYYDFRGTVKALNPLGSHATGQFITGTVGKFGEASRFDNVASYATATSPLTQASSFSVVCGVLFKSTPTADDQDGIVNTGTNGWYAYRSGASDTYGGPAASFKLQLRKAPWSTIATSALSNSTWYNLSAVVNGTASGATKLYVNGLQDDNANAFAAPSVNSNLLFACYDAVTYLADIDLAYCGLYTRALSATEIAQLHYAPYQFFWEPTRRIFTSLNTIAEFTESNLSDTFTTKDLSLSETQASNITDYSDLRVKVIANPS